MSKMANTPQPPYYAVIFTSERTAGDNGYNQMGDRMMALVTDQPGFLGAESVRDEGGFGMTISYWDSLQAIQNWKAHADHQFAQQRGKSDWYARYKTRICKVERDYEFEKQ